MENAIRELLKSNIKSRQDLMAKKRKLAKKYGQTIWQNSAVLKEYKKLITDGVVKQSDVLEKILRRRSVRTMSGIAPVAVLTKPFPCPGKCAYCPTEKNVPQSYLSNEPAVMRAIRCDYDPYKQVQYRLKALVANGHVPEKIELIVIGGTWSVLPEKYKYWYIERCFAAANEYDKKFLISNFQFPINSKISIEKLKCQLLKEQKKNETAKYKIIGITLETRPDYINEKELWEMRELGATRVEIGVQAIDDQILKLNKRGHGVKEITDATQLLKDFGFKVTYHIMPALPGSNPEKDLAMFRSLFNDDRFQPDQIKFYPTIVTRGSLLYRWWKAGKYKPYSDKALEDLIIKCKNVVPLYVRIIRLIRDIPNESIIAGNRVTNLRQIMQQKGVLCNCIRCREAREKKFKLKNLEFRIIRYLASGGKEYFIFAESKDAKVLYGFCRLRLSKTLDKKYKNNIFANAAMIRELHVYGELMSTSQKQKAVQHSGLGKILLSHAENIAKNHDYEKMSIISGAGVRGYYKKLGYRLKDSYMVKNIIK